MNQIHRRIGILLAGLVVISWTLAACGPVKKPENSMTSGHGKVGTSDAVRDFTRLMADRFEATYPGAFIDIFPYSNKDLIDSLLSERTEQILLDRTMSPAETLAFHKNSLNLFRYPVAYFPVFLLAPKADSVRSIDSASFRAVLSGRITNWKDLGGPDEDLHLYMPAPREGAWEALMGYFGPLDSVTAIICPSQAIMLDSAKTDPGALLVYSRPIDALKSYRALKFRRGNSEYYPDAETILTPGGYPFRLDITYVTTHRKEDTAAGFLTFLCGNLGQRTLMEALKYRPAAVPVKIVRKTS
jgi:hypothetical protein